MHDQVDHLVSSPGLLVHHSNPELAKKVIELLVAHRQNGLAVDLEKLIWFFSVIAPRKSHPIVSDDWGRSCRLG